MVLPPDDNNDGDLLQAVCTRWGSDPMSYGSYSSCSVGSLGPDDYDIMAEPLGDKVFFAGEATTKKYPATMHGAFATGLREAARITTMLSAKRGRSTAAYGLKGSGTVKHGSNGYVGGSGAGAGSVVDKQTAAAGQRLVHTAQLLSQVCVLVCEGKATYWAAGVAWLGHQPMHYYNVWTTHLCPDMLKASAG